MLILIIFNLFIFQVRKIVLTDVKMIIAVLDDDFGCKIIF
jgi:hypothetical protein